MPDSEICSRHPLRVLERAVGGGLGRGNIGCVLSRPGVGKTGFLVGVGVDALLRGRRVVHISTKETVEHLRDYYDQIFHGLVRELSLDDVARRHLEMERGRHILVYNRDSFTLAKLEQSVRFLQEAAGFTPDLVLMDGTPRFEMTERWEMEGVKRLAGAWNAEIWTSCHAHREGQEVDAHGIPTAVARFVDLLPVILLLDPKGDQIRVRILHDRGREVVADLHLELDPTTMLLRWR